MIISESGPECGNDAIIIELTVDEGVLACAPFTIQFSCKNYMAQRLTTYLAITHVLCTNFVNPEAALVIFN